MTKKIMLYVVGAMVALSLAACTPTVKENTGTGETVPMASTGGASDKVPDPNVEPMAIISVYADNDAKTGLDKNMDAVDELTAQAMIDKLIEYGMLPEGTSALSYEAEETIGTLDISALPEMDEKEKTRIITAIGNSFIENFELDELKLKVAGKDYEDLSYDRDYEEMK